MSAEVQESGKTSVFGQTLQPDEVILVEDGPLTPALYEVVEEFAGRYSTIKRIYIAKFVPINV